jgi:hypothetical protein
VEYLPQSPNVTLFTFFFWGYLKDAVCGAKPAAVQELWKEIECSCPTVQAATSVAACQSVTDRYQLCHKAVVILNTRTTFCNSISASADAYNDSVS